MKRHCCSPELASEQMPRKRGEIRLDRASPAHRRVSPLGFSTGPHLPTRLPCKLPMGQDGT
jgi:hypothetical protein